MAKYIPAQPPQTPATSLTPRTRFLHEVIELTRTPHPQLILRSATSGTFRDFGKNDDEKNRFLFLYLWLVLTFMSMIGGRNEVHYVSKFLFGVRLITNTYCECTRVARYKSEVSRKKCVSTKKVQNSPEKNVGVGPVL